MPREVRDNRAMRMWRRTGLEQVTVARGLAAALGLFALVNVVAAWVLSGRFTNEMVWWVDSRPLPTWFSNPLLAVAGTLLAAYAVRPCMGRWRCVSTRVALAVLLALSLWNTAAYWGLLALGSIVSPFPVPLSLFVALVLLWLWRVTGEPPPQAPQSPRQRALRCAVLGAAFLALPLFFPLSQFFFMGKTDYRRPADAAVVFGAAVWPGNRPSHALTDRVMTGVELYREGLVQALIFSGGPSSSPDIVHEVEAMRALAVEAGVPESAIILDPEGINTRESVAHTVPLFEARGFDRVLAVSHFYHLPRVKMSYRRAGVEVYTVPATERHVLLKLPYYLAREVAALYYYYLRPLWES